MTVHRRVTLGVGASIFDKLAVAGVQLLSVPVLAGHWGLGLYGAWVLLSTVPNFLAVSDFGFATAAGMRMTMQVSRGERDAALVTYQSAWAVVLISSAVMITVSLAAAMLVPDGVLPSAPGFAAGTSRTTLVLLLVYGIVALQGSLLISAFRCSGQYALGTMSTAVAILTENVAAMAAVVFAHAGPVEVVVVLLAFRIANLAVQLMLLRRSTPWLRLGLAHAQRAEARSLLPPALAGVALPLAQACFLQGNAVALGIAAGEAAVPAFTATRTLSRVGLQLTQLLNHALMPEYSGAVARDDRPAQAAMLVLTLAASAIVLVPFALLLALFGPQIVSLWTHGVIRPDHSLMLVMAATVVLGGFWNPLSNLILAMNRHATFSYPFVALAVATVPIGYWLSLWLGATGAGLAIAILDLGMCIVILRLSGRMFVTRGELATGARQIWSRGRALAARAWLRLQP